MKEYVKQRLHQENKAEGRKKTVIGYVPYRRRMWQ